MIITGFDGDYADIDGLAKQGFDFNKQKDFLISEEKYKYNFVGVLKNDNDDILSVFPKGFKMGEDEVSDVKKLFLLLCKYNYKLGNVSTVYDDNEMQSFPFNEFFRIYDYYFTHGLPRNHYKTIKDMYTPKINWKETIRASQKYINNRKLVIWGIKYERQNYEFNFLADCIIYAVNYTIKKFNFFLELDEIEEEPQVLIDKDLYPLVIERLYSLKNEVFKDKEIELISNLIVFFEQISKGYTSFIKTNSFHNIWQKMVNDVLSMQSSFSFGAQRFKIKTFSLSNDLAQSKESIEIDHYYLDDSTKTAYILDSKYRFEPNYLDYKQLFYWLFIRDYLDMNFKQDYVICCTLIYPTEGVYYEQGHIEINLGYRLKGLKVKELYFNMREMIDSFLDI